jgi:hypothetical protein
MDIATVVRMASAASGSPESDRGTTVPTDRSGDEEPHFSS